MEQASKHTEILMSLSEAMLESGLPVAAPRPASGPGPGPAASTLAAAAAAGPPGAGASKPAGAVAGAGGRRKRGELSALMARSEPEIALQWALKAL